MSSAPGPDEPEEPDPAAGFEAWYAAYPLGARSVLQGHQRGDETLTHIARRLVEEAKRPRVIESLASPLSHLKTPKQIAESCPGLTQGGCGSIYFEQRATGSRLT